MEVNLYNQNGKEIEKINLPDEIFGLDFNSDLVHQVVISQMANRRQVGAHTKDRGDVRGGGKKPWKQKGTGRARHGSRRSPIWKGGGVTFGPTKNRNFKKIIPRTIRRKALFMVLSQKIRDKEFFALDEFKFEKPNTKEAVRIINNQPLMPKDSNTKKKSVLIALSEIDKNTILSTKNIPKITTIQAKDLNCLDLLNNKYLIITKQGVETIKKTFLKA